MKKIIMTLMFGVALMSCSTTVKKKYVVTMVNGERDTIIANFVEYNHISEDGSFLAFEYEDHTTVGVYRLSNVKNYKAVEIIGEE